MQTRVIAWMRCSESLLSSARVKRSDAYAKPGASLSPQQEMRTANGEQTWFANAVELRLKTQTRLFC